VVGCRCSTNHLRKAYVFVVHGSIQIEVDKTPFTIAAFAAHMTNVEIILIAGICAGDIIIHEAFKRELAGDVIKVFLNRQIIAFAEAQKLQEIVHTAVLQHIPAFEHVNIIIFAAKIRCCIVVRNAFADMINAKILAINKKVDGLVALIKHLGHCIGGEGCKELVAQHSIIGIL